MKITKNWLKKENACSEAVDWFVAQRETDARKLLNLLIAQKKPFSWANWVITQKMTHIQRVQYAVFAAEQVLTIYEKKYPKDKRPRRAIEAAKTWIEKPTKKSAHAAADAAAYAAEAADTAAYAADTAAEAADTAAYAADTAAEAAYVADTAAYVAYAEEKIQIKVLKYGLKLIEGTSQ